MARVSGSRRQTANRQPLIQWILGILAWKYRSYAVCGLLVSALLPQPRRLPVLGTFWPYRYFIVVQIRLSLLCMMECISLRAFWLAERTIRCAQMLLFFAASASRSRARCSAPTGGTDPDSAARRGSRGSAQHGRKSVTAFARYK